MSFLSLEFIVFTIISLILYYCLPKKIQWIVLLATSYLFFACGGLRTIFFLLFTTLATYLTGWYISYCNELNEIAKEKGYKLLARKLKVERKQVIAICILVNFAILFFLKYCNYMTESIDEIIRYEGISAFNILLPLGISFYMFQSIGYVIDIYRNKYRAEKNFGKFALFVSFFPQVIQGPISKFDNLSKQLLAERKFSFDDARAGLQLIMWGFFKKLIVADRLIATVDTIYNNYTSYSGIIILVGVILYSIELYCDFSGAVDIARGIARLFGINLVQNFKRPIFATSLADFWRRWNISLGQWFKEYLFRPLVLSKPFIGIAKIIRKYINRKMGKLIPIAIATFIVYFVMCMWYGSGFNYLAFAIYNAVIITMSLLLEPLFFKIKEKLNINDSNKFMYVFQIIRTVAIVLLGRYITRAVGFNEGLEMLRLTFTNMNIQDLWNGTLFTIGLSVKDFVIVAFGTLVIFIVELFDENGKNLKRIVNESYFIIQILVILIYMITILLLGLCNTGYGI